MLLKWFLQWNPSQAQLDELFQNQTTEALGLQAPAQTYLEVLEIIRQLDNLSYVYFSFHEVFHKRTTTGKLSDPAVAAPLKRVY